LIKVYYVDHYGSDLTIVNAARVSFNASTDTLEDKDIKLINYLAEHEHMSPFEHVGVTVIIECPLYIRSQIHRHRTFAYNEVSRRYTSENLEFYVPSVDDIRKQSKSNRQASDGTIETNEAADIQLMMANAHHEALQLYNKLLDMGVCREQARGVLPQNLMTKFFMTGNLRNFAHFLDLRTHNGAQKEVRDVAAQLEEILKDKFPVALNAIRG
jgi:thymidylate synthase (FAD)